MARLIRKCTQCGGLDDRMSWKSMDEAANDGALERLWTCPACAWTEAELVDAEPQPSSQSR